MFEKKYSKPQKPAKEAVFVPETCGVDDCNEKTVVYIHSKRISRCARHYQDDVDSSGRSSNKIAADKLSGAHRDGELD
jgi:ribosomal protein S27E